MLDKSLTPEQQEYQQLARDFTAKHIIPVASEYDRTGDFPEFILKEVKEAGINCMAVPKEYGGPGLSSLIQSIVVEEWGYGCAGFATTLAGNGLSTYPVLIAGTDEQKKSFYPYIVNGGMGAFALTEPGAGSDAGGVATVAKREGDEYVINGTKCFCTTGSYASVFIIFASTDPSLGTKGISAFIVEREREGLTIGAVEHKLGIRSSNTVEVLLKNVRVPAAHLLGQEGDGMKIAMKTLDMARPIVGAIGVGLARRAMDECIKYVKERLDINGKPLAAHQNVQFRIADMAIQVEAARQLLRRCMSLKEAGLPYSKESAMAKTFATDTAMKVSAEAVDLMGEFGYSLDSVVEKLMRDAKVMQIYEGTNQIQRMVIAGQLLR
ncbi:acyl-CoA dehydrogenase family protein [Dehalobacter sp. DCM]|uniref:acyl-CoA dehydrogenase family protein n=1 Tax=Dehalobacter sp. DCM TaxID=2907827 RepID=UPI003081F288|nr:acyl-CoA dehydrogenase family protein [Dehalobacter sp. DCM]